MNNCVLNACLSRQVYSGKDIISSTISQEKGYIKCEIIENTNKNRVNSTNLLPFYPSLSSFTSYNMKVMSAVTTLFQEKVFTRLCTDTASGVGCKPAACANRPII